MADRLSPVRSYIAGNSFLLKVFFLLLYDFTVHSYYFSNLLHSCKAVINVLFMADIFSQFGHCARHVSC